VAGEVLGGEGDEMSVERLTEVRGRISTIQRQLKKAVQTENFYKAASLKKELERWQSQDPQLQLEEALSAAVESKDFLSAARIRDQRDEFLRRCPIPQIKTNRLLVLTKDADIVTMDPSSEEVRVLSSKLKSYKSGARWVCQWPTWSHDGTKVACTAALVEPTRAAMGASPIIEMRLVVFDEESGEVIQSVEVSQPPYCYLWSTDNTHLIYLSNTDDDKGAAPIPLVQLVAVDISKPDGSVTLRTLDKGRPLFFASSKLDRRHPKLIVNNWLAGRLRVLKDEGKWASGEGRWESLTDGPGKIAKFAAPKAHTAGNMDGIVAVENDWLISVSLDGKHRKRIMPISSSVAMQVSPDNQRVALLEQQTGSCRVIVIEGEHDWLDPRNPDAKVSSFDLPIGHITAAFWFSPDSKKLLCFSTNLSKPALSSISQLDPRMQPFAVQGQVKTFWQVYHLDGHTADDIPNPPQQPTDDKAVSAAGFRSTDSSGNRFTFGFQGGPKSDQPEGNPASRLTKLFGENMGVFLSSPDGTISGVKTGGSLPDLVTPITPHSRVVRAEGRKEPLKVQYCQEFVPKSTYLNLFLPFFDQYALSMTPWSPDSQAFCYVTNDGPYIQYLTDDADPSRTPPAEKLVARGDHFPPSLSYTPPMASPFESSTSQEGSSEGDDNRLEGADLVAWSWC